MSNLLEMFDDNPLDAFDAAEAAPEMGPLPKGAYIAKVERIQLNLDPTNGTPNCTVTFRIIEGPFTGRMLVLRAWLTESAMSHTKRDLGKIGIKSGADMKAGRFDAEAIFKLLVSQRANDDGEIYNNIIRFERHEDPQAAEASSVDTDSSDDEPSEPWEHAPSADGNIFDEDFGPGFSL